LFIIDDTVETFHKRKKISLVHELLTIKVGADKGDHERLTLFETVPYHEFDALFLEGVVEYCHRDREEEEHEKQDVREEEKQVDVRIGQCRNHRFWVEIDGVERVQRDEGCHVVIEIVGVLEIAYQSASSALITSSYGT
jgi:hypothetical protein